ncbi:MAG TPA: hypothetical protein VFM65_06645 [Flavobacteriaceae bacterium]|nr:hypothetical protein [Flavobacteriaceae bacterium]
MGINNGIFNLQDYRFVVENETKYFLGPNYTTGNVKYDGQQYYDVRLKYDLEKDLFIYNPKNASAGIGVNLIQYKVDSFSIYDKKFVNLGNLEPVENPLILNGYYQKIKIGPGFIFYTKFKKNKTEIIKNDKIYYSYRGDHQFLLKYQNDYIEISSESDVQEIFPAHSKNIQNFYEVEKLLESSNLPLFYQKLMFYINDLLGN